MKCSKRDLLVIQSLSTLEKYCKPKHYVLQPNAINTPNPTECVYSELYMRSQIS
jgi:hypothetical protein